jgi:hypothetical protein
LVALLREAGLRLVDLCEPGKRTTKQLVSMETLRKWRRGRRASIDSLTLVAAELTKHARRSVDWRDLVEDGDIDAPHVAGTLDDQRSSVVGPGAGVIAANADRHMNRRST